MGSELEGILTLYINKTGDCDDCVLNEMADTNGCIALGVLIAKALDENNKGTDCCISVKEDEIDG